MGLSFLTPTYGLVALGALLAVGALYQVERRAADVRTLLRLPTPPSVSRRAYLVALCATPFLVGMASMQPVLDIEDREQARTDAQIYFVMDISRSMLASRGPGGQTRFERARQAAFQIRSQLTEVPAGIASLTDRALPHLFPTIDQRLFAATLDRAIEVERPPPIAFDSRVTTLGALTSIANGGFYGPAIERRVVIVLTDAETKPFDRLSLGSAFRRPPGVEALFVRFWNSSERIYAPDGSVEVEYQPDARSSDFVTQLAEATEGRAFDEGELDAVVDAARDYLGDGETEVHGRERSKVALAPWFVGAAFLPLAFLLWRRNL
jgi:hypothetical protein